MRWLRGSVWLPRSSDSGQSYAKNLHVNMSVSVCLPTDVCVGSVWLHFHYKMSQIYPEESGVYSREITEKSV